MAVPACLRSEYELATYYLRGGMMVAIAEAHNKRHGRVLCEHLLKSGHVKIFCIEYFNQEVPDSYYFRAAQAEAGEAVETVNGKFETFFRRLKPNSARPNLQDLSALAISREIEVVPADPKIDSIYTSFHSLVPRDEAAAECIAEKCRNKLSIGQGGLVLWGEDHFVRHPSDVAFDRQGLHKLIRNSLPGTPVMLVNVANLTDAI